MERNELTLMNEWMNLWVSQFLKLPCDFKNLNKLAIINITGKQTKTERKKNWVDSNTKPDKNDVFNNYSEHAQVEQRYHNSRFDSSLYGNQSFKIFTSPFLLQIKFHMANLIFFVFSYCHMKIRNHQRNRRFFTKRIVLWS